MPPLCVYGQLFPGRRRAGRWACLWAWLACWLLIAPARAQPTPTTFHFDDARRKHITVPFLLQRNLIVVQVLLNGQGPYNFLLDTGISTSLITDASLRHSLGLKLGTRFYIAGAGEEAPLEAYGVEGVQVQLRGMQADNLSFLMLSEDILNLSAYVGMPIHGLLGADIFHCFVVKVQVEHEQLVFYNPTTFQRPRGRRWSPLSLEIEGGKPYVTVPVRLAEAAALPLKLVLDTGAGHALSIETSSDARLQVPPARLRTQLGRGLSGYINGYLGRVAALQLGRYQVVSPLTSFPDEADVAQRTNVFRNGNLGFELLKRFTVIIDYPHNRLLLKANAFFKDPFEHDMCGFDLMATGPDFRNYILIKIQPDSPAATAGLQTQDELLSINLLPVSQLSLTQVSRLFHSADGRVLLLLVRRASGELYTTTIRLKRQI